MPTIEGARHRALSTGAADPAVAGYGPYVNAGVPAGGFLNGIAEKGALVTDSTNGKLYINTGTKAATVWTVVGVQT